MDLAPPSSAASPLPFTLPLTDAPVVNWPVVHYGFVPPSIIPDWILMKYQCTQGRPEKFHKEDKDGAEIKGEQMKCGKLYHNGRRRRNCRPPHFINFWANGLTK